MRPLLMNTLIDIVKEEPDETIDQRIEELKTVEAMRRLERKKTIAADAVQILNAPEVNRNPAQAGF